MNRYFYFAVSICILLLSSCVDTETKLKERAFELCKYIPDHELLEKSKDFMTPDFYALLDTMFSLEDTEPLDHQWLYYFVTGNGGTIADYEVKEVKKIDRTYALATLLVRQKWEDGSFDPLTDVEQHRLYMEKQDGRWLISDFDEHKQDCRNYINNYRKEEKVRDAISAYLIDSIAAYYLPAELSVPVLIFVATEQDDSLHTRIYGDFWVFNYACAGDTLKTVSGGNHSGCMYVEQNGDDLRVTHFVQTTDGAGFLKSAKNIFGEHYDIFQNIYSNHNVQETVRQYQLRKYIHKHNLPFKYYQDFGWQAVEL